MLVVQRIIFGVDQRIIVMLSTNASAICSYVKATLSLTKIQLRTAKPACRIMFPCHPREAAEIRNFKTLRRLLFPSLKTTVLGLLHSKQKSFFHETFVIEVIVEAHTRHLQVGTWQMFELPSRTGC